MKFWRCQHGEVITAKDFSIDSSGSCGKGIYAMFPGKKKMQMYYSERGEQTYEFEIEDKYIKKLTRRLQYWQMKQVVNETTEPTAFICPHVGINIPNGKQIVITDPSIIQNITLIRKGINKIKP
jgi:hypothetical protein